MVAKLTPPAQDSEEIVKNIIAKREKQKDFFEALKDDWLALIKNYHHHSGDPAVILPLDLSNYISNERVKAEAGKEFKKGESDDPAKRLYGRRKESLKNLYSPKAGTELHAILDSMRGDHDLKFCPSCGEPGKPGTLDHYLPKAKYPELSIVLVNLTPLCEACQNKKGTSDIDGDGNKLFIHPYYDPIEDVALCLNIAEPYNSPSAFTVEVDQGVCEHIRSLFERHLTEIKFRERFEEFCIDEYSDLLTIFTEERTEDNPDSAERIIKRFLTKNGRQSPNRWEAIFYRGVLANTNLLEYLDNGDLPDQF